MAFEWFFDAQEIKRIHESGSAKSVKRQYIKEGYEYQLSFYGVLANSETGEKGYCRIEVLSNTPYDERIVALIYEFFYDFKPSRPYSIWIYNKDRDSVKVVGRYR